MKNVTVETLEDQLKTNWNNLVLRVERNRHHKEILSVLGLLAQCQQFVS